MTITYDPENEWTFTYRGRTWRGYESREAAAEALYDLERGAAEPLVTAYAAVAVADRPIVDLITSMYDQIDAPFRPLAEAGMLLLQTALLGKAEAQAALDELGADDAEEQVAASIFAAGYARGADDSYAECIATLERLVRERKVRAVEPAGSPITVTRLVCDDTVDTARFGTEIGTDYECGETLFYVPDERNYLYLRAFGTEVNHKLIGRDISDLTTLLNDPRVKAEIARWDAAHPA